jgi:1-acyl-sn-glycerol-3-phosphate acyltransferase
MTGRRFIPARPSAPIIWILQQLVNVDLFMTNRVHIDEHDIDYLRNLPKGAGIILTPNHADEYDPRVVLDLSRRCGRRFYSMCNREAFDENGGLAGWALQRIGHFSVERGAHDTPAKEYAVNIVAGGDNVLVVFPEGEIFYMNETVQPFHSGTVAIAMEAVIRNRATNPDFKAFVVPLAIKYTYPKPIDKILQARVAKMEKRLNISPSENDTIKHRLKTLLAAVLQHEQEVYDVNAEFEPNTKLGEHVQVVRRSILNNLANKYNDEKALGRKTIDASWELSARLREMLDHGAEHPTEIRKDISALHEVAQMVSWQPKYIASNPNRDRLAEVVIKLERELYRLKRPSQLAPRDVHLRIGPPIDVSAHLSEYQQDSHAALSSLTEQLHDNIQSMIDSLIPVPSKSNMA